VLGNCRQGIVFGSGYEDLNLHTEPVSLVVTGPSLSLSPFRAEPANISPGFL